MRRVDNPKMTTIFRSIGRSAALAFKNQFIKSTGTRQGSVDVISTNGIWTRDIHTYERPVRYVINYRKELEARKNPVPPPPSHRNSYTDWNYDAEIFAFQKRLNEEIDDNLLRQALIDKAFAVKENQRQEELGLDVESMQIKDNDSMSVMGHNLLQTHLGRILRSEFPFFPEEGINALQDYLTSNQILADISSHIGTKDLIQCQDVLPNNEVLARAFTAILFALNESSGEERLKRFVEDFVVTYLSGRDINEFWQIKTPWGMLTDILNSKGETFEGRLLREAGRNTLLSVFVVGLYSSTKELIGKGTGETVEIAQEMAARDALSRIFKTTFPRPGFKFLSERVSARFNSDLARSQ